MTARVHRTATKLQMEEAMRKAIALEAAVQERTGPMEARVHELITLGRNVEAQGLMASIDCMVADVAEAMADALKAGLAPAPRVV